MSRVREFVAFAAGVSLTAIAVSLLSTGGAGAGPGDDDATFVPITPCRLFDTRPAPDRVGAAGAFAPAETKTFAAHGTNGECTIPTDATGLVLNVTAVGASEPTFLTIWPDGTRPLASSLNPSPGQPPTPNAVTTDLAADGTFRIDNLAGTVDALADVTGYYTAASLQEIAARLDEARRLVGYTAGQFDAAAGSTANGATRGTRFVALEILIELCADPAYTIDCVSVTAGPFADTDGAMRRVPLPASFSARPSDGTPDRIQALASWVRANGERSGAGGVGGTERQLFVQDEPTRHPAYVDLAGLEIASLLVVMDSITMTFDAAAATTGGSYDFRVLAELPGAPALP